MVKLPRMKFSGIKRFSLQCHTVGAAILLQLAWSAPTLAVGLVYVDADDGAETFNANLSPLSAIDSFQSIRDNLWGYRSFGSITPGAASGSIFESSVAVDPGDEDSPELTLTIDAADGLVSATSYDIYIAYWSATGQDWTINAGLSSGNYSLFNRTGPLAFLPSAIAGSNGGAAIWSVAPTTTAEGDRVMLLGKVGTATPVGGQIQLYINDLPTSDYPDDIPTANAFNYRSWLDGVAFVEEGSEIFLSATVDRDTGNITISNATSQPLQVVSYSITSGAGALDPDPGSWLSISANYDEGGGFDTDVWNITAPTGPLPSATGTLSEEEDASGGGSGGTLAASGSLNLGNAWIRTPYQDVQVSLTLDDASVINLTTAYAGDAIEQGDLNADGDINPTDAGIFLDNLHTSNAAGLTDAESYQLGDVTGDQLINFADFAAFQPLYDAVNGAGAFAALGLGVPEPSSFALLALGFAACAVRSRRRSRSHTAISSNPPRETHLWTSEVSNMTFVKRVHSSTAPMTLLGILLACGLVALLSSSALAQITYVDATEGVAGNTALAAGGTFTSTAAASGTDGLWRARAFGNGATIFEAGGDISETGSAVDGDNEDVPRLVTTISGLTPSAIYNVYTYLWDTVGPEQNWPLRTDVALTNPVGELPLFNDPVAALAVGTDFTASPLLTEGDRVLRQANLGPFAADGSGQIRVFIDDDPAVRQGIANGWQFRTWYDGVGYEVATLLTLEVNTTTGAVSIKNTTSTPFDINYYEIRSANSLNNIGWNSLDDQEGGDPVGTGWDEAGGSSSSILSEVNLTSMLTLNQDESASLGNAFSTGAAQDLEFFYAAPGGTLEEGLVQYVAGLVGDYNGDNVVDARDYTVWRDTLGSTTDLRANGDNTGGSMNVIDEADYLVWKNNFGATLGSGSQFLASAVPEPSSIGLFSLIGMLFAARVRFTRRL